MIGPLRHVHQQAIERLQPFKKGNLGKKSPLYLLHELNNADKHRLLQVVGAEPVGYLIGGVWGDEPAPDYWMSLGVVFEDGAKVGRVAAADVDKRKVQIEQRITPIIAFWRGCEAVQGRRVTPMLSEIAGHVSRIVGSFAPDFP